MRFSLKSARKIRLVLAVVFFLALLASTVMVESHKDDQDKAHSPEVGDLMEKLDADFVALVQAVLVVSVQELVSETPFTAIEKQAGSIAATAKILPRAEEFRGDNSMLILSRQLEAAANGLAKAARSKNLDAAVKALVATHGVCVRCHEDARF
jgi:cytochrome c556